MRRFGHFAVTFQLKNSNKHENQNVLFWEAQTSGDVNKEITPRRLGLHAQTSRTFKLLKRIKCSKILKLDSDVHLRQMLHIDLLEITRTWYNFWIISNQILCKRKTWRTDSKLNDHSMQTAVRELFLDMKFTSTWRSELLMCFSLKMCSFMEQILWSQAKI